MFNKKIRVFLKDKRSQIGETMTWVVATVIIIIILSISIFIATSYLGKNKGTDFLSRRSDLLASESFFAYLLTENSEGQTVHEQLKNEENLNDFNGNLAIKIFEEFYKEEYSNVWVGTVSIPVFSIYTSNVFFGDDPGHIRKMGYWGIDTSYPHVMQRVKLSKGKFVIYGEENKYVEMILTQHS